jgi:hypothetical protein
MATVGESLWRILPARQTLARASEAIQVRPEITHCNQETCERCNDAVSGGPIL